MSAHPNPSPRERWRVRQMHRADLERVVQIEREIYPFPWTPGNFEDSLKAGYDCWIFESARETIGYAIVMWAPDEVHLLNISVSGRCQGQGYGRAMLGWLCEGAARRGARSMMLEVRPSNERARALYASTGFVQLGVRRRYYPAENNAREDALVLFRTLTPAPDGEVGA